MVSAIFEDGIWSTTFSDGETITSRFLVSAIGQLHIPKTPEIKGAANLSGVSFHSAQWDHSYDYRGKRIAVIGNAASAIQLIPELAEAADNLTVYHRTPNWIIPKKDRAYSRLEKWLGKRIPALGKLYRFNLFAQGEFLLWRDYSGQTHLEMARDAMGKVGHKEAYQRPRAAREDAARLSHGRAPRFYYRTRFIRRSRKTRLRMSPKVLTRFPTTGLSPKTARSALMT